MSLTCIKHTSIILLNIHSFIRKFVPMLFIRKDLNIFIPHTPTSQNKYSNFSNKQIKSLYCHPHGTCPPSKFSSYTHVLPTLNLVPQKKTLPYTCVIFFLTHYNPLIKCLCYIFIIFKITPAFSLPRIYISPRNLNL